MEQVMMEYLSVKLLIHISNEFIPEERQILKIPDVIIIPWYGLIVSELRICCAIPISVHTKCALGK